MQLLPHILDIWQITLNTPHMPLLHLLSPNEQTRYHRFHFEQHKTYFAKTRIALRILLAQYLNMKPDAIDFEYGPQGKPRLKQAHLHFNVTHSAHIAYIAMSQLHPVGIDFELFSKRAYIDLAQHVFSETEQHYLQHLPYFLLPLGFFSLWSKKEALIKACGLGLSYPLKTLSVTPFPYHDTYINEPILKQTWKISAFMPYPASCAAVCYHPSIHTLRHFFYDPTQYEKNHTTTQR